MRRRGNWGRTEVSLVWLANDLSKTPKPRFDPNYPAPQYRAGDELTELSQRKYQRAPSVQASVSPANSTLSPAAKFGVK